MSYDKNLTTQIAEEFRAKRQQRTELIASRRTELYAKIPELKRIDDEIATVSFSVFKKVADGYDPQKAAEQIKNSNDVLCKKRDELIKSAGFPVNYLNPSYACPICHDEGFIDDSYCSCFRKKLTEAAFGESNLAALSKNTFDKFSLDCYSDEPFDGLKSPRANMQDILGVCREFADNFGKKFDNLLFTGTSGLGKTFLSSCIANALIPNGFSVIYQSASVIFSLLDRIKFSKSASEADEYTAKRILDCDLLILDDLGTEFISEFSKGELFRLLNTRFLTEKSTIISTNLTMKDLNTTYLERIFSRLTGNFSVYKFYGKDIRFTKKIN